MPNSSDPFKILPAEARKRIRRRGQPAWWNPMLATLTREPFSDPDWFFEAKLDGIRCLTFRKGNQMGNGVSRFELLQKRMQMHVPVSYYIFDVLYLAGCDVTIAFTEWTSGGKLRHPRYLGLRIDKKPKDVVREA